MRVKVEVVEYYTQTPVVDARVTLRVEKEGLIPAKELEPLQSLFKSVGPRRYSHGEDEVARKVWVVRRSWLEANMKARTREQAQAIAADWGSECGPDGPSRAELVHERWTFTYPCMIVRVDPWTGTAGAQMLGQDPITSTPLYPPEEALADAFSGPLEHVGTGVWYGRYAIPSCVYRNQKVFVVNGYCTTREINPTRLIVLHPERGVVTFNARGDRDQKVSRIRRDQYEHWGFSSADPYPGLHLKMGFKELVAWEERRHRFYRIPSCGAGLASATAERGRCAQKTPEVSRWWDGVYPRLLETPPERWYQLVKALRKRAPRDGKPDPRTSGSR